MSSTTFSFACQCGAKLQARQEMAGKVGKCKFCGAMVRIPLLPPGAGQRETVKWTGGENLPPAIKPATGATPNKDLIANATRPTPTVTAERTCSICQTALQAADAVTTCQACGLPFHADCWQGNLGCATYGCRNVNVLKQGPDIAIGHAAVSQAQVPPWQQPPTPASRSAATTGGEIPWEHVLLAISAVAGLLSCVTCGFPSMLVAVAATIYYSQRPQANLPVLGGVWAISGITALFGMIASLIFFLW